jgi:predicted ferric reductase
MPAVTAGVIGLGAVAVLGLWWKDTPAITSLGDGLVAASDILGLLAGYGFVVLVGLMARLPPLERGIGADQLGRWHAMGGRYVITLVTGHVLTVTWGYAVIAHESVVRQAVSFLTSYTDVLYATVAWFLLLVIAAISARAVRRRVSYESWYYVHLLTYASIALAFSHQFAQGPSFVASLPARVAWSLMYAIVGGLIVWFRFVTPLRMFARHRFAVMGVREEAPGVVSVYITGRNLDAMRAEPGQFFRWRFLARGLWWTSAPYSLSAPPGQGQLRITVKAAGDHSRLAAGLKPGTRVVAEGPYGAMIPAWRKSAKVALIAGGVGITPLRALFEALPGDLTLIYRVTSSRDIVFRRELEQIAEQRGARLWFVAGSRAELGGDPLTAGELLRRIPGLPAHDVYVCGPAGMTQSVIRALREAGVRRGRIHHESFEF